MSENALIKKADFIFDDIGGTNGQNFRLTLDLKTSYGGAGVSFNPIRLPQLLQQLGLEKFSDLVGTYVQIPETKFGEEVSGIKSIMAKDNEDWFKTENHIYFGSEFNASEDLKKENEELKKVLGDILIEVKKDWCCNRSEIKVGIKSDSSDLMVDVLKKYGGLEGWYE